MIAVNQSFNKEDVTVTSAVILTRGSRNMSKKIPNKPFWLIVLSRITHFKPEWNTHTLCHHEHWALLCIAQYLLLIYFLQANSGWYMSWMPCTDPLVTIYIAECCWSAPQKRSCLEFVVCVRCVYSSLRVQDIHIVAIQEGCIKISLTHLSFIFLFQVTSLMRVRCATKNSRWHATSEPTWKLTKVCLILW